MPNIYLLLKKIHGCVNLFAEVKEIEVLET